MSAVYERFLPWLAHSHFLKMEMTFAKDGEPVGVERYSVATNHQGTAALLANILGERSEILSAHPEGSLAVSVRPTWCTLEYMDPDAELMFVEFIDSERYRFQGSMPVREAKKSLDRATAPAAT